MNAPLKLALCVATVDLGSTWRAVPPNALELLEIPNHFWDTPVTVENRATCETDTKLQQLLPYIVLVDGQGHVFSYARGAGGGEARLHAKLSIGVGGHVDAAPPVNTPLKDWLRMEAQREVLEEVALNVEPARIEFQGFLVDKTNEVGQVHLGLLAIVRVDSAGVKSAEAGIIDEAAWVDPYSLLEDGTWGRLEPWSKLALAQVLTTAAPEPRILGKDKIREVLIAHGFTVKEGQTDLKPYVYEAAEALLRLQAANDGQAARAA